MIENINVRFFAEAMGSYFNTHGFDRDCFEITEACFITLHNKPGILNYDRNTVFANGVKQICLTVICDDLPYADDLEIIE